MKSMTKHSVILFAILVTCSLLPDTNARPNGFNELFTVLAPSATAKPGSGDYKPRDFINDGMKNNLAFLNEICPPLARVADKLCQAVQSMVQRCIEYFVNGKNMGRSDTTTTESSTDTSAEETTPSSGSGYDSSNPKFGGDSSSESSSSESSSENSTDKPSEKEGQTTTPK